MGDPDHNIIVSSIIGITDIKTTEYISVKRNVPRIHANLDLLIYMKFGHKQWIPNVLYRYMLETITTTL